MGGYASTKLGKAEADELLASAVSRAGEELHHAVHPRAWVSIALFHAVADAFEERLGETFVTDTMTWAIPARREVSGMSLSAVATPDLFYRQLDRARGFFARHLRFEVHAAGPGSLRVQLHYRFDVPRVRASCSVARGVLIGVPLLFDLPPATVEEHTCWADGAPCCTYDVKFHAEPPLHWIGAALGAAAAAVGAMLVPSAHWLAVPVLAWMVGRELHLARVRRLMTRVSEEHRRALADNDREFQRRYNDSRALTETLEQRVGQRTVELQRAMTELRARNAALRGALEDMKRLHGEVLEAGAESVLDSALSELEHEINNPMSYVLANLDQLASDAPSPTDLGELASMVQDIRTGVDSIRSVVAWFVNLHRTPAPGSTARCEVAEEITETVRYLSRRWGARITVHLALEPAAVDAHGRQLTQVFANLLKNASEALGCGNVWITVARRSGRAVVTIKDDGPGIRAEDLPHLFERGFTTRRKEGGSGLGLYISRAIVERHGGTLGVRSDPGAGALFEVDLPLARETAARSPRDSGPAIDSGPPSA
jgi:signal transduction histidine kinase